MPELPDITLYIDCLRPRVVGKVLNRVIIRSPFVLRTVEPSVGCAQGKVIRSVERLGKRIVFESDGGAFLVLHLMIAGRLHWKPPSTPPRGRIDLACFQFDHGTLLLTEAGTRHRASLHVAPDRSALQAHNPGGIEPLVCDVNEFKEALKRENHTIKRVLTDPRTISGIGNAYSDEILHAAKISPIRLTSAMSDEEITRLHAAMRQILTSWIERLRTEFGVSRASVRENSDGVGRFPGAGDITAFRPDFAVHGRFRRPCPACGSPVQRIVHAGNETNYCATCQTGGRVLADRSLSRLLKDDWPRTIEEWERTT